MKIFNGLFKAIFFVIGGYILWFIITVATLVIAHIVEGKVWGGAFTAIQTLGLFATVVIMVIFSYHLKDEVSLA